MIIFLIFLIASMLQLPDFMADLSINLRFVCTELVPKSNHSELISGITCGTQIQNPQFLALFRKSGLIHLLVVSGGHLIFLQVLLTILLKPLKRQIGFMPLFILLGSFTLFSGAEPPCVRSLVEWSLGSYCKFVKRSLLGPLRVLLSGLLTLILFPEWVNSYSFLLSWSCSLALQARQSSSAFEKQLTTYVFLFVFLLPVGSPHPVSIYTNLLLAPVLGLLLFPICLLNLVFTSITPLVETMWGVVLVLLEFATEFVVAESQLALLHVYLWWPLLTVHIFLHLKRMKDVECES